MNLTSTFVRSPVLVFVISAVLAVPAHAALTAQQVLEQFNLVVFDNLSTITGVEGRAFVGGSVMGQGNFADRSLPASSYAGLTVLGTLNNFSVISNGMAIGGNVAEGVLNDGGAVVLGNATNVNFNGSTPAYVAGSTNGVNFNSGRVSSPNDNATLSSFYAAMFSTDFRSVMNTASDTIKGLASNSVATQSGGRLVFNANPINGVAVFNIDSFAGVSEFEFNLGSAQSVFINSGINSGALNINFLGGSASSVAPRLVWNFYDASTLNFSTQWGGSILATDAAVSNSSVIEGNLVAESFDQSGQMHLLPFAATLPVPEPSTYAMFGAGLLALMLRRRRQLN